MLIGTQSIKFASVFPSNSTPYGEISVDISAVQLEMCSASSSDSGIKFAYFFLK